MKLKYYLRGLGIGIIVTLLLTGIAGNKKQEMTDEEIKARAAELGMIESTTLSEPTETPVPEPTETPVPEPTDAPTSEPTQEQTEDVTDIPTPTPEPTATATPEPTATPTQEPGISSEIVTITVNRGYSSEKVSALVEEAGLIQDARDFNLYLCENGYDKRIVTGVHRIPMNATYEEIAMILTGR